MAGARGSARRELVARLFRPGNRRRRPRVGGEAARAGLLLALPAIVAVAGSVVVWPHAREAVRRHPYFALREVVVRDVRRIRPEAVRAAAGIEPGMSVWDVDVQTAERRLREHEWIRAARVRRELPHRVTIHVREERPAAIVVAREGEEYYVSARGRIFARLGVADARDLPSVTGLARTELTGQDPVGSRALRRALALLRRTGGILVSEVHVDRTRGLTLMPVRPAIPVELGWNGFEQKLARSARVMALWAGREAEIAGMSLLFDDEVIVRTHAAAKRRAT